MDKYPYPPKRSYNELNPEDFMSIGSATDCTGLIPSAVESQEEFENYAELYNFLPPPADETPKHDSG